MVPRLRKKIKIKVRVSTESIREKLKENVNGEREKTSVEYTEELLRVVCQSS